MDNAVHQIIFDNDEYEQNNFSSLLDLEGDNTIDFSVLMPIPTHLKSDEEIRQWCYENWKNTGTSLYAEIVDEQTIEFETNNAPCLPFIKLWAEKYQFTGEYRAISSDLKEWVVAHFTHGVIDTLSLNDPCHFNTLCYELRGSHYYEFLETEDALYTKYLADVISYHSAYVYEMDGKIAKFRRDGFEFNMSYDHTTDLITIFVNGEAHVSTPLHEDLHPSGLLERFVDVINAIYKEQSVA